MGESNKTKLKASATTTSANTKVDTNSIERNKYVYDTINGWIENADNKVGISCGVFTAAFGIITFLAEYIKASNVESISEIWFVIYKICFVVSLVVMALSLFFYAKAIIPNLKSSGNIKPTQKKYPIFYGDICSINLNNYQKLMEIGTDKDFADELILECWHNSRICSKKTKFYKIGVITSIVAISLAFCSFGVYFVICR